MIKLRTKRDLIAALRERDIHLTKRLGQVFLIDHNVLDFVVRSAGVEKSDLVFEVGSGSGLLTRHLAEAAGHVVAVEVDQRLVELCRDHTEGLDNIALLNCEAMQGSKVNPDVERAVQEALALPGITRLKMVAGLPYAISTAIIPALLEGPLPLALMVCTVQEEVSDRLAAAPGSKDYGPLSVIVQAHARIEALRALKPSVFFPEPKVSSAVVRLTPADELLRGTRNYETFSGLARSLFLHRRKKVAGALVLAERFRLPREKLAAALGRAGVDEKTRADQLSVRQIIRLANEIETELTQ